MIKAWFFDLSRVLLFPADINYTGELNKLYKDTSSNPKYNFWDYFRLDEDKFNLLSKFKTNHDLYIFTQGSIQNAPELRQKLDMLFKKIYSAEETGLYKSDPASYKFIANDLG
jgi:FMN phosphatase YigB (HAD superfamily)